jgi:hypothetical protein
MRHARQVSSGAAVVAAALLALASGCQKHDESLVIVTAKPADGAISDLYQLVVTVGTIRQTYDLSSPLTTDGVSVGIYLPDSVTGDQAVHASATHGTGACAPGYAGGKDVHISKAGASVEVVISMAPQSPCSPDGGAGTGGGGGSGGGNAGNGGGGAGGMGGGGPAGSGPAGSGGKGGGAGTAGGGPAGSSGKGGGGPAGSGGKGGGAGGSGPAGSGGRGGGAGTASGSGGKGGGAAGTGGGPPHVAPNFAACIEVDHGDPGVCAAGCTVNSAADVHVYGVAFSPTNPALAVTGGTDGRIKVWTNTNGVLAAQGTVLPGTGIGVVAFSPDGSTLAVGRTGGIDIVNVSTWTVERTLVTLTDVRTYGVAFSNDGAYVFAIGVPSGSTTGGALFVFAVGDTQSLLLQAAPKAYALAVSPANVSGGVPVAITDAGGKASIYTWSPSTKTLSGPVSLTVTVDNSIAETAAFASTGTVFAAGGDDGLVNFWNYPTTGGAPPDGQISLTSVMSDQVGALAFTPSYGWVAVGGMWNGSLSGYSLANGAQVGKTFYPSYDVISLAFAPNANVIVAGEYDCGCVTVCPQ